MKLRIGACALVVALAGCSGGNPESGVAGMRGVAATQPSAALPAALPLARAIGASIANAPDRGALLSYPDKQKAAKQEGAYTWYPTAISEAHAFKAVATGEMTVPSPDGSQVKLRYERHVEEIDGNWTWIGRVVGGDPMQEAIITFGEKAVFGSIPQANGKPALSLQTRNGRVFAVQTDSSKVVSATKGHVDMMIPEAAALRSSMGAAVSQSAPVRQGATMVAQSAPQTSANTIDVAIGYTPEFATANGGASGAATRLVFLINVGNQAFRNSDVNGYLRIVHALQVSYTNTNSNQTALSELTGSNGQSAVTVPASLAPLRTARDQYGADIAVLVRKFNTPENEGCGIAWLNGANQTAITAADAPWGYAVISDGYDQGTDSKTYYCADETLVHEAAHLMGSAHDRANSTNSSGGLQYGRYAYSFGYKTAAAAGNFYTVMAYGDTGQLSHRIFSTPLKNTCGSGGNLACGVANSEDNARSLNQTIPIVASFRAVVVPFPPGPKPVKSDLDGDGKSDIFMRHLSSDAYAVWFMRSYAQRLPKAGNLSPSYTPVATGDFDGDGIVDVLWTSAGRDLVFTSYVNGAFRTTTSSSTYAAGYTVVGAGDLNGDRQADVILFNSTTRQYSVWFLANLARKSSAGGTVPVAHRLVAVGDFDGDGRDDLLWTSSARNLRFITWKSGLQQIASSSAYTAGYSIAGSADMDGDGQAELIVHNTNNGAYSVWFLDDFVRKASRSATVPVGYSFAMAGDFTGGKREVILWTNSSRQIRFSPYGKDDVTSSLTYAAGYRILSTF
jgi:hypothetical protein